MTASRVVSPILRVAQFVFASIVLGLTAWFLYQRARYDFGPLGRTIYTLVVAALSVIASLVWMIPSKSSTVSYASDLFFSLAWFAAFGVLVNWYRGIDCGSAWYWGGISFGSGDHCGRWNAAQVFSFLSAAVWVMSFILGILTYHHLKRNATADGRAHRSRV